MAEFMPGKLYLVIEDSLRHDVEEVKVIYTL